MKLHLFDRAIMLVIAVFLGIIALRPLLKPEVANAQEKPANLYIEPRTTMLNSPDGTKHVIGKVVINLDTGGVWGFPTTTESPYPVDRTKTTPPTSVPIYLGKLDFSTIH
jgi:hypothetical protein